MGNDLDPDDGDFDITISTSEIALNYLRTFSLENAITECCLLSSESWWLQHWKPLFRSDFHHAASCLGLTNLSQALNFDFEKEPPEDLHYFKLIDQVKFLVLLNRVKMLQGFSYSHIIVKVRGVLLATINSQHLPLSPFLLWVARKIGKTNLMFSSKAIEVKHF